MPSSRLEHPDDLCLEPIRKCVQSILVVGSRVILWGTLGVHGHRALAVNVLFDCGSLVLGEIAMEHYFPFELINQNACYHLLRIPVILLSHYWPDVDILFKERASLAFIKDTAMEWQEYRINTDPTADCTWEDTEYLAHSAPKRSCIVWIGWGWTKCLSRFTIYSRLTYLPANTFHPGNILGQTMLVLLDCGQRDIMLKFMVLLSGIRQY